MIYIHAYPFRVDDPERNTRQMTALARSKNLKAGDVLLFPFQALTGTVQEFWNTRPENRSRNAHWLSKLAASLIHSEAEIIVPAVMPEGLGVLSLKKGQIKSLDFEWIKGGVAVKAERSGLDYDLNFRSAAVGEAFEETDSNN